MVYERIRADVSKAKATNSADGSSDMQLVDIWRNMQEVEKRIKNLTTAVETGSGA